MRHCTVTLDGHPVVVDGQLIPELAGPTKERRSLMTSYDRLRVLWPDHLGLARGGDPPWRIADRGTAWCVGTYLLDYQRNILDVEIGVDPTGLPDIDGVYDLADVRPGWEPGTGVVVADLDFHGEPYVVSACHALRNWRSLIG